MTHERKKLPSNTGSEERFGYEWSTYRALDANYERQFIGWLGPITREFIRGKRILDAGCGMGRNAYWCLRWGAAEVVALDNDPRTAAAARDTLCEFQNATVRLQNIYDIVYRDEFDLVFCIGVIHHLAEPARTIANLVRALRPGGTLLVWVYGREGNEALLRILDPVRKRFTSRLPPRLLDSLTYLVSVPFWLILNIVRPRGVYYDLLRQFRFKHVHSIIFDQLLPTIATYYTREAAQELLRGLSDVRIVSVNGRSWTVTGSKPA